jgi:hypothetical protein
MLQDGAQLTRKRTARATCTDARPWRHIAGGDDRDAPARVGLLVAPCAGYVLVDIVGVVDIRPEAT